METLVGNAIQQNIEDSIPQSIGSDSLESPTTNKLAVQLPTIRYPSAVAPPLFVDPRQRNPFLSGVEYRTTTFTQLQVAQTTFRYPPTPPVEVGEGTDRLLHSQQQHQPSEAPALSHLNYTANGETATSEKNTFPSLPTPPDLVPSSDIDSVSNSLCSISPQSCPETNSMYYRNKWSTSLSQDMSQSSCLNASCSPQQTWGADPMTAGSLLPIQPSSAPVQTSMHPTFLFSLPQVNPYGEGMSYYAAIVSTTLKKERSMEHTYSMFPLIHDVLMLCYI